MPHLIGLIANLVLLDRFGSTTQSTFDAQTSDFDFPQPVDRFAAPLSLKIRSLFQQNQTIQRKDWLPPGQIGIWVSQARKLSRLGHCPPPKILADKWHHAAVSEQKLANICDTIILRCWLHGQLAADRRCHRLAILHQRLFFHFSKRRSIAPIQHHQRTD